MYPPAIAIDLRARGHDVISVHESPGRGTPDMDVFASAQSDGRAVVTENVRDVRPLVQTVIVPGGSHFGLIRTTA